MRTPPRLLCALILVLVLIPAFMQPVTPAAAAAPPAPARFSQVLRGKDAVLGNLMYARLLDGRLGGDTSGLVQENILEFLDGNRYRLQKTFRNTQSPLFSLSYVFNGAYLSTDQRYTLKTPESTRAEIDWADLAWAFPGQSGRFSEADSIAYPRAFNTPFLGDDNGDSEMYVTCDLVSGSFEITGNQSEQKRYRVFDAPAVRDGLAIYGNFTLPAEGTGAPWPLVVFAHGFAGNNAIQRDVAVILAQHGIASYRFDFIGGTPYGSRSDGNFYEMSMLTEKQDLLAVMDFVTAQDFVDPGNIFLFGESMGGAVAAMAAAEIPEKVRGQLHFYPAFSISEQTRAVYKTEADIPERAGTSAGIMVARKFYADALTIEIFKEIAPYPGPVLMFHGALDRVVPLLYARQAAETLENADLVVYESEGHGFTRETKYRAISRMIRFIDQWMAR